MGVDMAHLPLSRKAKPERRAGFSKAEALLDADGCVIEVEDPDEMQVAAVVSKYQSSTASAASLMKPRFQKGSFRR